MDANSAKKKQKKFLENVNFMVGGVSEIPEINNEFDIVVPGLAVKLHSLTPSESNIR